MDVPVAAKVHIIDDEMMTISILSNGKWFDVVPPFNPYCYSTEERIRSAIKTTQVNKRILGSDKRLILYKHEFPTVSYVTKLNQSKLHEDGKILESHVRFIERVAIDVPDFFRQYKSDFINYMILDIEVINDRLLIGCYDGMFFYHFTEKNLKKFVDLLSRVDILVGYNIENYDLPVIQRYMKANKVYFNTDRFIVYDVAKSVFADQTLFGIKRRGLKEVAEWFGWDYIELDWQKVNEYSADEIIEYNKSDLVLTDKLYNMYIEDMIARAEYLGVPLNVLIEGYESTEYNILCGRACYVNGVVSDGKNSERHPDLGKIQGAYVDSNGVGLYNNIVKMDFKQMYPTIAYELNLSPENTHIVGEEDYGNKFKITYNNDKIVIHAPDENLNKTIVVEVDNSKDGYMRKVLDDLGKKRDELKKLEKETDDKTMKSIYHSKQWAMKVLRNKYYGSATSKHFRYADISIGIAITATARELMKYIVKQLNERRINWIEVDTDGIYIADNDIDEDVLDDIVANALNHIFKRKTTMKIEYDYYDIGYFMSRKNYILKEHDKLTIHGSALKGTHRPNLYDKVLKKIINKIFSNEISDIYPEDYLNWNEYDDYDFIMRRMVRKDIDEYANSDMMYKLARQIMSKGEKIGIGTMIEYYKSKNGFSVIPVDRNDIDYEYYKDIVLGIFKTLGLDHKKDRAQTTLF